jgi:beta-glucuronidase
MTMRQAGLTTALVLTLLASLTSLKAQQPTTVLADVDHRQQMSLNGQWHYIVDPYRNGIGNQPDNNEGPQ